MFGQFQDPISKSLCNKNEKTIQKIWGNTGIIIEGKTCARRLINMRRFSRLGQPGVDDSMWNSKYHHQTSE